MYSIFEYLKLDRIMKNNIDMVLIIAHVRIFVCDDYLIILFPDNCVCVFESFPLNSRFRSCISVQESCKSDLYARPRSCHVDGSSYGARRHVQKLQIKIGLDV